jgi:hypothetical protein
MRIAIVHPDITIEVASAAGQMMSLAMQSSPIDSTMLSNLLSRQQKPVMITSQRRKRS